ncbi:MAG: EAL domain-containing protein [Rhodospirillales bacterium]|nr:EAL domain-containing protein [Rhodospirillales bacterium]
MNEDRTIGNIMRADVLRCQPSTPLSEAAQMMQENRCGSILVMEGEHPVGIWTEHDAMGLDLADSRTLEIPIGKVMSAPLVTTAPEVTVSEAGRRMKDEGLRHLVVTGHQGKLLGIVSQTDVIKHFGIQHYMYLRDVRSAVPRTLVTVDSGMSFIDAMKLMRAERSDAAVVLDGDSKPIGIVTERDILRQIAKRAPVKSVEEVASKPLFTVSCQTTLLYARDILEQKGFRHLGVVDDHGELAGILSFSDILASLEHEYVRRLEEALHQRDRALEESKRHLNLAHKVIEASLDGIIITDSEGLIEAINPAFTTLTGYLAEEVIGQKPGMLRSGRHDAEFYRQMWNSILTKGHWQGEVWNRRKNGDIFPEWLTITRIQDTDGGSIKYAGIFSDITERKKAEERIRNLAYFDVLTGLPNRRLFNDRLAMAINSARRHHQRLAILFLDLDLFKRINDTLGHSVGDRVLEEMAARLKLCMRDSDTVSRMGGDEFTILMSEIADVEDAVRLARRVVDGISQPFLVEDRELFVTTSIGISVFPEDGDSPEVLVKNADIAMYRAKDLGRNSYQLYTPQMNAKSFERLAMENELRKALERDEFLLNYQVKVNLDTGGIAGAEALVRWKHPDLGLVPPVDFIPLAEDTGLIIPLGEWVLRAACLQNKAWQDRGLPPIRMAVNISPHQFNQPDLVGRVRAILDEAQLDPKYLELEVTESVLIEHMDIASFMLNELRSLGVVTSIDDFGTGYSSLAYLKRIPIDALKIDASFMHDLTTDDSDAEIVSAIIGLAHNLRLKVVAEGVENEDQIAFLRSHGCDEIQGYLVSRPVSSENFERLFAQDLLIQPPGIRVQPKKRKP